MNNTTRDRFVRFFNAFGISVNFSRDTYENYSDITQSRLYRTPQTYKCELQMYEPLSLIDWLTKASTVLEKEEFNKNLIANNEVLQQAHDNWIMILALQGGKI